MTKILVPDYEPSPRQSLFHKSQAFETLYGGAAGGGKTAALVAEAVTSALEYPGISIYIFRRTIPELKKTIQPEIRRQCGAYISAGHMRYLGADRVWEFSNGSTINLAYCQNPGDEYNYQGAEIQLLMFDELTHFPLDQYEYLKTRIRSNDPNMPLRVMAATNPGNIGHGWVKTQFIDAAEPETVIVDRETEETRLFIPAKVSDHPSETFRENYGKRLKAIQDPDLRRALWEGDWDVFAGQVFTEWRRVKHVVQPFAIPDHWNKWFSYDWGYNTWAAGLWFAKDPGTGRTYVYRELYESKMGVTKQAQLIYKLDGNEGIRVRLADPAIWKGSANADTGETVAQLFQKENLHFTPANNDRIGGKNIWHEMLSIAPDGLPWLQVFENCTNLIRTLPTLPYDDHKVEDVDTDAEDHLYDAGRYGLMNQRPSAAPAIYKPQAMLRRKYSH